MTIDGLIEKLETYKKLVGGDQLVVISDAELNFDRVTLQRRRSDMDEETGEFKRARVILDPKRT